MSNIIVNHKEAYELACYKQDNSNLARCYIEMHDILNKIWHSMNDYKDKFEFPMKEIETILEIKSKILYDY